MRHDRFDRCHEPRRPQFLAPPPSQAATEPCSRPLVGLAGLAVMLAGTAVLAGLWLGVAAVIAWRVFQWLK